MKAFPVAYGEDQDFNGGMDLRDYFATRAMHAMLVPDPEGNYGDSEVARRSYRMADEMLKARGTV